MNRAWVIALLTPLGAEFMARAEDPPGGAALPTAASPAPEDPAVTRAMEELARRSEQVHDLTARFEEQKYTALLRKPMVSRGRLRIVGDVARWETESPHEVITRRDRGELRIYYPQQKTVEVFPLGRHSAMPDISPLPAPAELREHFRMEPIPVDGSGAGCSDEACLALRLHPRTAVLAEHIRTIDVVVDRSTGLLRRAEVKDPDGDRTVLVFSEVRVNTGLKAEDLDLDLPAGTKEVRPLPGSSPSAGAAEAHKP